MQKTNQKKAHSVLINPGSKQIKYIPQADECTEGLEVEVSCPEEHMEKMRQTLDKSSKSQDVKNSQRLRPNEVSGCRISVRQYETEEMRMEKAFEVDLGGGKQQIELEIPETLAMLYELSKEKVRAYIFGVWAKKIDDLRVVRLRDSSRHIMQLKVGIQCAYKSQITKQFSEMVQKVCCFCNQFDSEPLKAHFNRQMKAQFSEIECVQDGLRLLFYTKDQPAMKRLIVRLNCLSETKIELKEIFRQGKILKVFIENELKQLEKSKVSIQRGVSMEQSEIEVIGEISELNEFEGSLHRINSAYKLQEFEWELNSMVQKVLKERRQDLTGRNSKQQSLTEKTYIEYQASTKKRKVTVWLISRNSVKLDREYTSLLNKLMEIETQVIVVPPQHGSLLEKLNLSNRFASKVTLEVDEDIVIIAGDRQNLQSFLNVQLKKILKQTGDYSVTEPNQQPTLNSDATSHDEIIEVMLDRGLKAQFTKAQFARDLEQLQASGSCVSQMCRFRIKCKDIDKIIHTKIQILELIGRHKKAKLEVPLSWNSEGEVIRTVVEIDLTKITEPQKKSLNKKLEIDRNNSLFIARAYRIEDIQRYCLFKRFNSTEKTLFYSSPYPLDGTIHIIQANRLAQIATFNSREGLLQWRFKRQPLYTSGRNILLVVMGGDKHKSEQEKETTYVTTQGFYPQYVVEVIKDVKKIN